MSLAIATTVVRPSPTFTTWLDYHLKRVELILIYSDDHSEMDELLALCDKRERRGHVVIFPGSEEEPEMSRESRIVLRQRRNLEHAIAHLLDNTAIQWLLHIDVDELLWENGDRRWATCPGLGCVSFTNHEALPPRAGTSTPFHDCVWFKVNDCDPNLPFTGYRGGKSAVRLSEGLRVVPSSFCYFEGYMGERVWLPGNGNTVILHYPCMSFEAWVSKYLLYGDFTDYWFDNRNRPIGLPFMLKSRDEVKLARQTGNWGQALAFWESWTVSDETLQQLIPHGLVRRYAPLEDDVGGEGQAAPGADGPHAASSVAPVNAIIDASDDSDGTNSTMDTNSNDGIGNIDISAINAINAINDINQINEINTINAIHAINDINAINAMNAMNAINDISEINAINAISEVDDTEDVDGINGTQGN